MWGIYKLISLVISLIRFLFSFFFKKSKQRKVSKVQECIAALQEGMAAASITDSQNKATAVSAEVISEIKDELSLQHEIPLLWWYISSEQEEIEITPYTLVFDYDPFGIKTVSMYARLLAIKKDSSTSLEYFDDLSEYNFSLTEELLRHLNLFKLSEFLKAEVWSVLCLNMNASPLSIQFESANEFVVEEEMEAEIEGIENIAPFVINHSFVEREVYRRQLIDDENGK